MRSGWTAVLPFVLTACGLTLPLSPSYEEPEPVVDPCESVSCEPGTTCVEGECVPDEDPCAGVQCPRGRVCVDGECVPEPRDRDGDGFTADVDCDDGDPDVRPGSTRPCETNCGSGLSTCEGPRWSPCSAPVDCDCQPGERRPEDCGACGVAERVCAPDRTWGELGPCLGRGACEADARERRDCGPCAAGRSERVCGADCQWGPWPPCELADDVCVPGQVHAEICDECSEATQTCAEDCQWSAPTDCELTPCEPGETASRLCLCGGEETRTCLDQRCFDPWPGCPTDVLICRDDGQPVPCEGGCGQAVCRGFCAQDCSVPCHCFDAQDDTVHCPGDRWLVPDGCGPGVDADNSCTELAGRCSITNICPLAGGR